MLLLQHRGELLFIHRKDAPDLPFLRTSGHYFGGAAKELAGQVTGFDHITEVRDAMRGVRNTINRLNGILGNPNTDPSLRALAQTLLGRASRALDAAERVFQR